MPGLVFNDYESRHYSYVPLLGFKPVGHCAGLKTQSCCKPFSKAEVAVADPLITPTILGANCLIGLITGPVGNRADWAVVNGARKVGRILRLGTPSQNHHIMRATQAAYVDAMRDMAKACAAIADDAKSTSAAAELAALTRRNEFKEFRYDGEHFPLNEANAAIDRMFAGGIAAIEGGGSEAEHRAFGNAILQDLAVWGISLSELQERLFTNGVDKHAPWHLRFRIAFGEQLINDEPARSIFTQERLGEIRANGIALIDAVADLQTSIKQGLLVLGTTLGRTDSKVDRLVTLAEQVAIPVVSAQLPASGIEQVIEKLETYRDSWERLMPVVPLVGRSDEPIRCLTSRRATSRSSGMWCEAVTRQVNLDWGMNGSARSKKAVTGIQVI